MSMLPLTPMLQVIRDRAFLFDGSRGLCIVAFDPGGRRVGETLLPHEKIPVDEAYKRESMAAFRAMPQVKPYWDMFSKMYQFYYPEHFPPLQYLAADESRLYLHTHRRGAGGGEFIVLGSDLKKIRSPFLPVPGVLVAGTPPQYAFHAGDCYFIRENEEDEVWELFAVPAK
jgi:hypothetical protein